MKIELAHLGQEHINELSQLLVESISDTCRQNNIVEDPIRISEIDEKIRKAKKYLANKHPDEYMICGIYERKVVAVGGYFSCGTDILLNCNDATTDDVEIASIYVHPSFQRLGFGRNIYEALTTRLQERGKHRAFIDSGYNSSQKYWTKMIGQPRLNLESNFGPTYRYMIWELKL